HTSTLLSVYGTIATSKSIATLRNVTVLVSTGNTDMYVVEIIQAVISTKNVYANASMWVVISPVLFGGFAIRAIEPIESESPKIKSASVSIRGCGWAPPVCCCIGVSSGIVCIWSFVGQPRPIALHGTGGRTASTIVALESF